MHAYEFDNLAANDVLDQVHRLWVRILNLAEYEHLKDEVMQVNIRPYISMTMWVAYHLGYLLRIPVLPHTGWGSQFGLRFLRWARHFFTKSEGLLNAEGVRVSSERCTMQ